MTSTGNNPRICLIGEGMLELSGGDGAWQLGYGGDTINTAIHLARYGRNVAFASALGADPFSDTLRTAWAAEGIDTALVLTAPDRITGLYAIRTDDAGERSFTYWRGESAARAMLDLPDSDRLLAGAGAAEVLAYSLITLAILPEHARERLFDLCAGVRARGGTVVFDGNYRPRLWPDAAAARAARDRALAVCDIGLPTLEDEIALGASADPRETAAHWRGLGTTEVVVKLGAEGCLIDGTTVVPPPAPVQVIDSSGAGDAFNAGYLNARLSGAAIADAAIAGHRLAGWAITRPGAVPAKSAGAPYLPPVGVPSAPAFRSA